MTHAFPLALIAAAAVIACAAAPSPCHAQGGPGLGDKTLYTSDVQFRSTIFPDRTAMSVVFDNLGVALVAGSGAAPTVTRVFPLQIPVTGAGQGATLRVQARGGLVCPDGAACLVILWVNGQTKVLSPSMSRGSPEFTASAEFSLPGADVHQAAVVLIAERENKRNDIAAMLNVASLDLTIAPKK